MKIELLVINLENSASQLVTWEGEQTFTIGRNYGNIRVDDTKCSRLHAACKYEAGNSLLVTDLKSKNGIYLNGEKVQEAHIKLGQSFVIGDYEFVLMAIGQNKESTVEVFQQGAGKYFECMPVDKKEEFQAYL